MRPYAMAADRIGGRSGTPFGGGPRGARGRRAAESYAAATVIAIVVIAAHQHAGSAPIAHRLPSSAQQWVDQWTAASLGDPARVCRQLFAPALVRASKPRRAAAAAASTPQPGATPSASGMYSKTAEPRRSKPNRSTSGAGRATSRSFSATCTEAGVPLTSFEAVLPVPVTTRIGALGRALSRTAGRRRGRDRAVR